MSPRVEILSYFSLPTDLARGMSEWPEFVSGDGYDVTLRSADGSEIVETRFESGDDEEHFPRVVIEASSEGQLFERALGFVTYALAAHSDNLQVSRTSR